MKTFLINFKEKQCANLNFNCNLKHIFLNWKCLDIIFNNNVPFSVNFYVPIWIGIHLIFFIWSGYWIIRNGFIKKINIHFFSILFRFNGIHQKFQFLSYKLIPKFIKFNFVIPLSGFYSFLKILFHEKSGECFFISSPFDLLKISIRYYDGVFHQEVFLYPFYNQDKKNLHIKAEKLKLRTTASKH